MKIQTSIMNGRMLIFEVISLSVILLSFHNPLPEDFTLAWPTYLGGGTSWDQARDVCVDKLGNVIVVGGTASLNFPTTANAYDTSFNAGGTQC